MKAKIIWLPPALQDLENVPYREAERILEKVELLREFPEMGSKMFFAWDDFDFELPHFAKAEARQAWLDSLPHEEAEVDERLKKRVTVMMNLHQLMVDGFDHLAKRMGLNSGKDLMYIVLSQYLNRNLPDDF